MFENKILTLSKKAKTEKASISEIENLKIKWGDNVKRHRECSNYCFKTNSSCYCIVEYAE